MADLAGREMPNTYVGPLDAYQTAGADGVVVSATSTYYSTKFDLKSLPDFAFDLYWGINVGTFTVQVSNKPRPNEANDNDWKALSLSVAIVQPTGSNTGDYVDLSGVPFRWCRMKYVNASASDTIHAYVAGKGH